MATSQGIQLFNTDPNVQAQAALIQQRQALAQKLLEEGLKPVDTANRQIGGVAYHVSPMEGLAKMLQSYVGRKGMTDATKDQASLAAQAYGNLLERYKPGSGESSYTPEQLSSAMDSAIPQSPGGGPPSPQDIAKALGGQAPANRPAPNPNNPMGIPPQLLAQRNAGMMDDETFKTLVAPYMPTDATKAAIQGGMDPMATNRQRFAFDTIDPKIRVMKQAGMSDEQINQAVSGEADKARLIEGRAGQSLYSLGGNGQAPQLRAVAPDPGNNMQFGVGQNGQVSAQPVPGSVPNKAGMAGGTAGASAAGTTAETLHEVTRPDGSKVKVLGKHLTQAPADSDQVAIFQGEMRAAQQRLDSAATPQDRARAQGDIEGLTREMARNGIPQGQSTADKVAVTAQAGEMQKRFTDLQNQNAQAQTTNSYLRNIKELAATATTGRFSDKLQYVNSLLSSVGNEKATDATTANNLLDKYSNQIVARLGQGGLGTDAARSILQSAYPNAKMTKEAIHEAADNLIGANEMLMAKARALSPHGNARDSVAYQQKEQLFDQNADPRMWQYAAIKDPTARKQFIQKVLKDDPTFLQKAEKLHAIGAL